jgi:hypothetical protein
MTTSSRAPLYDLFKLIVAIILLLIFLLLLFLTRPSRARQHETPGATSTPLPSTPSNTLSASLTVVPASSASIASTMTPVPTDTPLPTASSTNVPTRTPTPLATESPVPETLPTPIVEIPAETDICEAISRSQLQVGMQATIIRRLNFRSSPGIRNNWMLTNIPSTQVEIIGGPSCTRYQNGGAYLWWQIKLPDGSIGWSAEASAFGAFYFMEPIQ